MITLVKLFYRFLSCVLTVLSIGLFMPSMWLADASYQLELWGRPDKPIETEWP